MMAMVALAVSAMMYTSALKGAAQKLVSGYDMPEMAGADAWAEPLLAMDGTMAQSLKANASELAPKLMMKLAAVL